MSNDLVKELAAYVSKNVFHGALKADIKSIKLQLIVEIVAAVMALVSNVIGYSKHWWTIDAISGIIVLVSASLNLAYWAVQNCREVVNSKTIIPKDSLIAEAILFVPGIGRRIVLLYSNVCQLKKGIISVEVILVFVMVVLMVNTCRYGRKLTL